MIDIDEIKFNEKGLVPVIVQEVNGEVLMFDYMNREALQKTIDTGNTWFYDCLRNKLWQKGTISGNKQIVSEIFYNCDKNALLVKVHQNGVACKTGTYSCFTNRRLFPDEKDLIPVAQGQDNTAIAKILNELYQRIKDCQIHQVKGSYTYNLFSEGQDSILAKLGMQATKSVVASKNLDRDEILSEMGDLWYHCLILLAYHNITPEELLAELMQQRHNGKYHDLDKHELKKYMD